MLAPNREQTQIQRSTSRKILPVKTMDEFVKQWDKKISKIIHSMGMASEDDDIKQEIYTKMVEQNGLANYDPNRGAFSTYCYALILTVVRSRRSKMIRERISVPVSLDELAERRNVEGEQSQLLEKIEKQNSDRSSDLNQLSVDFRKQLEQIIEKLRTYPVRSHFFRNGECICRDLATLLELIMQDKSRKEILEYMQYSTGSVGILFDQLQEIPEIRELREMILR